MPAIGASLGRLPDERRSSGTSVAAWRQRLEFRVWGLGFRV